jgi:hypothetical protein
MPRKVYANGVERAEVRRAQKRVHARAKRHDYVYPGGINRFICDGHRHVSPPAEVLAERDRLLARTPTINEALLGDPPPGRRAIDMRSRS